ncbi:Two component regulator propeller [Chryseobacterium soldanellicola]|uniref:Two component regulator propeller n=1 Tax=Chryseobacterium soldanellicola TaxID=311333 RepID=A0A1H1FY58_9FLAO|nr:histidine kinase [Chryseobacterium soldanellicola]SDR05719.1 Two component regulator propeller [Chryseobacterium soldanellicola]
MNYSEENGLNSSYTYQLSQDNNGFIWIGSDNGFFRFDGKEFKQYTKKDGLKNLDVLSCNPLSNGEIFIVPFLSDFAYLKNGKIINSDINKKLKEIIQFGQNPVAIAKKDSVFLYTRFNPKNIYIYKNGNVHNIPLLLSKEDHYIIAFDPEKNTLYSADKNGNLEVYNILTKKKTSCNIQIKEGTYVYKKDHFFACRNNGKIDIYKIENNSDFRKIQSLSIREGIHQLIFDKNNRLWVCLENGGVLYFDQPLSENVNFSSPVKLLDNFIINDILADKDNNIWFSTRNNGIYFITDKFFRNYIQLPIKNNSSYITAISSLNNNIILGYNEAKGGIFHSKNITDIILEKNRKIEHKAIFAKGNIIIFGLSRGIFRYNTITKQINSIKAFNLKNIIPYSDNSVLFCTSENLTVYNFVKNTFKEILPRERVYTALSYHKDSLFVGTFKDLYKFNTITKKRKLFLEGYYFTDLKKLKENLFVGATNLNGIIIFNKEKILKKITENDGLSTSQIKKIDVQNENIFWASTNSGLSRIEIKEKNFLINNFTQSDGLPSNVVAGCVIKKDRIFVGTSKGLGILSISKLLNQQKFINKKVTINSIIIGNKEYFNLKARLVAQNPNNEVIFNLSFPDYTSQGKINYKYKIEGLDDDWQLSSSSKIIFNSIPHGKYIFKVYGIGYNGKQSFTATEAAFEIKPKFWQTWIFRAFAALLGIFLIWLIITVYFQKKRNKKLETLYYEKKIAELELQAIKAQINPHFIYNCLNSIQFLLYKKDYPETENYLDIFSQMIRKTLYYSEKTFMPIREEVEYLSLYLNMEKLRLKDVFDYKITVSDDVNPLWKIPSLLIQPFVENAIKHGVAGLKDRKGQIDISFTYNESTLCITIEDNGVGIDNKPESILKTNSFGVKLSQKRIETFKQLFETKIILEINNLSEKLNQPGTQIKIYITPYENKSTGLHH